MNPNVASVERQQSAREILKEMKITTLSYAKNFAVVGCIFSAIECTIESVMLQICALEILFLDIIICSQHIVKRCLDFSIEVKLTGKMARMQAV